jgi:putative addiction module killer protein
LDFVRDLGDERPSDERIHPLLSTAINAPEPIRFLREKLGIAAAADTASADAKSEELARRRSVEGFKNALEIFHPRAEAIPELARKLARVQRKAGVPYESMVSALQAAKDPFDLLEEIYINNLRLEDDFTAPAARPSEAKPAEPADKREPAPEIRIVVPEAVREHAQSLGVHAFSVLQARLFRASMGNFGQCERIAGGILELQIDSGPGYRAYLSRESENEWSVLKFGTKATQTRDIAEARKARQAGS